MHRSTETELQLRTAANAADRKNRPKALVAFPAALLVVAVVYTIWSLSNFVAAGSRYSTAAQDTRETYELLQALQRSRSSSTDFTKKYQHQAYLLTDIGDDEADGSRGHAAAIGLTVRTIENKPIPKHMSNDPIGKRSVNVHFEGQELEKILAWIDACLQDERYMGRLFVDSINLKPNRLSGWDASPVTLSIYEVNDH